MYMIVFVIEEFQPDSVTAQVTRYAKTVYQMEKGLPSNSVVPKPKAKVDAVKDIVSWHCI